MIFQTRSGRFLTLTLVLLLAAAGVVWLTTALPTVHPTDWYFWTEEPLGRTSIGSPHPPLIRSELTWVNPDKYRLRCDLAARTEVSAEEIRRAQQARPNGGETIDASDVLDSYSRLRSHLKAEREDRWWRVPVGARWRDVELCNRALLDEAQMQDSQKYFRFEVDRLYESYHREMRNDLARHLAIAMAIWLLIVGIWASFRWIMSAPRNE